jgi:uncharacterized membrane protein YbhN (UPF0104 family)
MALDPVRDAGARSADLAEALGEVPWVLVGAAIACLALAATHYLLAALALRTACGEQLALRETALAQLAAAVANRITPSGLGAAGVNVRFLSRRGMSLGAAVSTVGALGLLGAVADVLFVVLLLTGGGALGLGGGQHELRLLARQGLHFSLAGHVIGVVAVAAAVGVALAVRTVCDRRRSDVTNRPAGGDAVQHLRALIREPRRAALTMAASAGTTVVLAVAFAVVVRSVVGEAAPSGAALLMVYLVGAAAGTALSLPAITGATEAILIGALIVSGVAAGPAAIAVLLFRGITSWAPLPAGVLAARALRHRRAL